MSILLTKVIIINPKKFGWVGNYFKVWVFVTFGELLLERNVTRVSPFNSLISAFICRLPGLSSINILLLMCKFVIMIQIFILYKWGRLG